MPRSVKHTFDDPDLDELELRVWRSASGTVVAVTEGVADVDGHGRLQVQVRWEIDPADESWLPTAEQARAHDVEAAEQIARAALVDVADDLSGQDQPGLSLA